ncbi:hypothetical protein ABBQ38_008297 [Trebouxia sp. C0009 RCD-2024]
MANEDFDNVLSNVLIELASPDESKQAAASAVVAVLLSQAPEGRTLSPIVVPALLPLLSSGNLLIQRNSCAALIAVAELEAATLRSEMDQWHQALEVVARQIRADSTHVALRITSAEVLGAVGSSNQHAAAAVFKHQGVEALLTTLRPEIDSDLQGAGLDSLCKLAAEPDNRQHLTDKGVLPALVRLLDSSSREVQVRVLLCLGMLMGDNQQQQIKLAEAAGALPQLLQLRLQTDDEDCKQISDGIVAAMLKNPQCKQQLADALRSQHAGGTKLDKYVS